MFYGVEHSVTWGPKSVDVYEGYCRVKGKEKEKRQRQALLPFASN